MALVLSRKVGEQTAVGNVVVTVLSVCGNRVKLGFEGPKETYVRRMEIPLRERQVGEPTHET